MKRHVFEQAREITGEQQAVAMGIWQCTNEMASLPHLQDKRVLSVATRGLLEAATRNYAQAVMCILVERQNELEAEFNALA